MSDYVTKQELRAVLEAMWRTQTTGEFGVIAAGIAALDAQPAVSPAESHDHGIAKACAGFVCHMMGLAGARDEAVKRLQAEVERLEEERSKAERRYADAPTYQAAMRVLHDTRDAATAVERKRIAGVLRREATSVFCRTGEESPLLDVLAGKLEQGEA